MVRILLAGFYGMDNTGDDALLTVADWGARTYFTPDRIYATAKTIPRFCGSASIRPIYTPATRFRGENRLRGYLYPALADQIIFGGGSVFHSSADLKAKLAMLKLSGKGLHAAVGVSIGPFKDAAAEKILVEVLKRLSFVGLRDQESLEIAQALCPDVRAEKTFDLAALLPRIAGMPFDDGDVLKGRRGLGFALCNVDRCISRGDRTDEDLIRNIIRTLDRIPCEGRMKDEEIVFIDFNGNPDSGDHQLQSELSGIAGARFNVRHLRYASDPVEVLKTISGLRAVVAMRLHAAVFAYVTQTPAILLSYHTKCRSWAAEIGMPAGNLFDSDTFDPGQLARKIEEIVAGTVDTPTLHPREAERLSLGNWEWLHA